MVDYLKLIAELKVERESLSAVIAAIERLAAGGVRKRGRPPQWMKDMKAAKNEVKRDVHLSDS